MAEKRRYGMLEADWDAALAEIREILIQTAKTRKIITYSELTNQLKTVSFHPGAYALHALLQQVCHAEDNAGRGLLCSLVVRQADKRPGAGYYKMAAKLGRDIGDSESFWQHEIEFIYTVWST